jgi:hypothetical protein
MRSTLLFSRAMSHSALALVAAATLAACDNDKAVAPIASAPTAPSLAVGGTLKNGTLSIALVDQNSTPITTLTAQFTIATPSGLAFFALDNGFGDADSTAGKLLRTGLVAGTYQVCQTVAPTDYVLPATTCQSVMVGGIVAAKLTFVDPTVPRVKFAMVDMLNRGVGGGTFKVWDGIGWGTLTDNAAGDLDPAPGRFEVKAPANNGYSACALIPPPGWVLKYNLCNGQPTIPGQTIDLGSVAVEPEYSVYFYATDYEGPVGPSSYLITNASGFSKKLTDEGLNDMWTGAKGKLWIKLPSDGDYQICQTVAPPNTQLADPVCKTIRVSFGEAAYAGLFVSKPL